MRMNVLPLVVAAMAASLALCDCDSVWNPWLSNRNIDAGTSSPAVCGIVPQTDCPTSDKCTTHDNVTTTCDRAGTANRGDRCTTLAGVDNCAAGNLCADAGGGVGQCRSFCRVDNDCQGSGLCKLALGTSGLRLCTQLCNALGAGCGMGLACYVFDAQDTDCLLPGTVNEGQACAISEDCQPGMACLGPAGAMRCYILCLRGFSSGCPGTEVCHDISNADGSIWSMYGMCM